MSNKIEELDEVLDKMEAPAYTDESKSRPVKPRYKTKQSMDERIQNIKSFRKGTRNPEIEALEKEDKKIKQAKEKVKKIRQSKKAKDYMSTSNAGALSVIPGIEKDVSKKDISKAKRVIQLAKKFDQSPMSIIKKIPGLKKVKLLGDALINFTANQKLASTDSNAKVILKLASRQKKAMPTLEEMNNKRINKELIAFKQKIKNKLKPDEMKGWNEDFPDMKFTAAEIKQVAEFAKKKGKDFKGRVPKPGEKKSTNPLTQRERVYRKADPARASEMDKELEKEKFKTKFVIKKQVGTTKGGNPKFEDLKSFTDKTKAREYAVKQKKKGFKITMDRKRRDDIMTTTTEGGDRPIFGSGRGTAYTQPKSQSSQSIMEKGARAKRRKQGQPSDSLIRGKLDKTGEYGSFYKKGGLATADKYFKRKLLK